MNYAVFTPYITFPKPIVSAVNGPAMGMGVTTVTLTDYVVAAPSATFCTPFIKLGVPFEGCSSFNFERRFGRENAAVLLDKGETINAETALRFGLVNEIVDADVLVGRATEIARKLVQEGQPRPLVRDGLVEKCLATNDKESITLAETVINVYFFQSQMKKATAKGQSSTAWTFWAMS